MQNSSSTLTRELAVEPDVVNLRAPAVLISILFHVLALLALPLLDLPTFRHRMSSVLEAIPVTHGEAGDRQLTQVVLSPTLPDSDVAAVAEQFAARPANPVSAGGQSAGVRVEESHPIAALEGLTSLSQPAKPVEGPSEFDPAGTRDSLPSRTDVMLRTPDPRENATPLLTPDDMSAPVNQEQSLAIAAALRWLVSQQSDHGYWSTGQAMQAHNNRVSATSLALLPLTAMQQTHERGTYSRQVQSAVDFLLSPDPDPVSSDAEAQRALTLRELFIATRDARVRTGAKQAIDKVLVKDYRPLLKPHPSSFYSVWSGPIVTVPRPGPFTWQIFAMRAAEFAGLQDNTNVIPTLRFYSGTPVASAYSSTDLHGSYFREVGAQLAAAGCAKNGEHPRETDYFTTLFLARVNHSASSEWQAKTTEHLLATQNNLFPNAGSWSATHGSEDDLTATTYATLILTVPSESIVIYRRP